MKTLLLSIGFLILSVSAYADDPHNHILNSNVSVRVYNPTGDRMETTTLIARQGQFFEVKAIKKVNEVPAAGGTPVLTTQDYYIVQFWYLPNAGYNPGHLDETNTGKNFLYCMSQSDFTTFSQNRYKTLAYSTTWSIGTLSVPIKFRPRKAGVPGDLFTDFTVGATVGLKTRVSRWKPTYISIVGALAAGNYSVDSLTTRGQYSLTTNLPGITYGFGVVIEFNRAQVFILSGWDYIGGFKGQNWIYNNRNWVGFGIGYQLLKPKEIK